jgi:hypothetical protein
MAPAPTSSEPCLYLRRGETAEGWRQLLTLCVVSRGCSCRSVVFFCSIASL